MAFPAAISFLNQFLSIVPLLNVPSIHSKTHVAATKVGLFLAGIVQLLCVLLVRDNFMIGIKYNSLADLNGQALAWCNKVNGKVHATINEIPFERLKKEGLSPLKREYIIDKINLRRVQKDCLISYAGNQYSVPAEYVGKDVAVVALDNMLAAYYEGKQIALHRISYQKKDIVVNHQHYRRLTLKHSMDVENPLLEQGNIIDFPLKSRDLSRYDEVLYE